MKNNSLKIYVEVSRKLASNTFHILLRSFGTQQTHTSHCIQISKHACRQMQMHNNYCILCVLFFFKNVTELREAVNLHMEERNYLFHRYVKNSLAIKKSVLENKLKTKC